MMRLALTEKPILTPGALENWWHSVDRWSIFAALVLMAIGCLLLMSTSPSLSVRTGLGPNAYLYKQITFGLLGVGLMLGLSLLGVRDTRRFGVILFGIALALLLLLPFWGDERGGATRWFSLGIVSLQPSEFVKPAFIVAVAWMMSVRGDRDAPPGMLIASVLLAIVVALLVIQPDYGQSALLIACWGILFYLTGASIVWAVSGGVAAGAGVIAAYFASAHFAYRIDSFLSAEAQSYQLRKTLEAIGQSGWFGLGPGEGVHRVYVPDAHSDFVIAVAAEEYGLALGMVIIVLYLVIVLRAFARMGQVQSAFRRLAGCGLASLVALQSVIHMGVATRLLPTKGMTLPFISYGGSSLIASCITMGMLLALTRTEAR